MKEEMKEYEGKRCKLLVKTPTGLLYYRAKITKVTNTHISFLDFYNVRYTYHISAVYEINEMEEKKDV